jgi:hypothetical protein
MDHDAKLEQPATQGEFAFDDMGLHVGARLQIQIPFRPNAPQYLSTLIGYVKDEYLILKTPFENGLSVTLPQESTLAVRVLSGVHVFAFSGIVRRVFLAPLFYIHLSFPDRITGTVVRKALRASVALPVAVTGAAGDAAAAIDGRFSNLSATGGFIEAPTALGEGEHRLHLSFAFRVHPGNREVKIETDATIRNVRALGASSGGVFGHGVRFEGLGEDEMIMIQNLVYQALTENRGA